MGTLTVRENLRFSAALRLHVSVPQVEKEARVNHLIKELGLTEVADSKVLQIITACPLTSSLPRQMKLVFSDSRCVLLVFFLFLRWARR